jgi:hypothetical protein
MNWIGRHYLLDLPVTFQGFKHVDGSFYNTLNIGENELVTSKTIHLWKTFCLRLILLTAIGECEIFFWHKECLKNVLQIECRVNNLIWRFWALL